MSLMLDLAELDDEIVDFPAIPANPIDYETLNLFFRKQGEQVFIEAAGPGGERVEVPTDDLAREGKEISGDTLGAALMPGNVLKIYAGLLQKVAGSGKGLRIQLDFPGAAAPLAHLPWEKARIGGQTIVADPRLSIVRTVSSPIPALPFEASQKPYRILMVLANPQFYLRGGEKKPLHELKLDEDYKRVKEAVQPLVEEGLLELILLQEGEASLENVARIINEKEIHSLFFSGNGVIGRFEDSPEEVRAGYLLFDSPSREAKVISGSQLIQAAGLSREKAGVRMVFLSACHTAYGKNGGEGVAEALLRAGVPSVVAFNTVVFDQVISNFIGAFFAALIEKNSLELAMFAGRKVISETAGIPNASWSDPILFSRVREGKKVFAGELVGKVATYVNDQGKLEVMEQKGGQSAIELFNQLLKSLAGRLEKIGDSENYAIAQNLITKANRELRTNPDLSIDILSDASLHVARALKEEEAERIRIENNRKKQLEAAFARQTLLKKKIQQRSIVLGMAGIMFVLIGVLSAFLDGKAEIGVLGLPLPVVLWSFIGGIGATLYAFVGTQQQVENEPFRLDWLIGRPLVGVIMGCVVYLAVATSISALTSAEVSPGSSYNEGAKPYLLWALAFLGGFSDKFALLLFDNLVGKYTSGGREDISNDSNQDPVATQEPEASIAQNPPAEVEEKKALAPDDNGLVR